MMKTRQSQQDKEEDEEEMEEEEDQEKMKEEEDDVFGDDISSDLTVEKFGPLVYITGNGEKFMGSEIESGWEFYNNEDVIVTVDEMCAALGCSVEQLKDTVGMDDEAEEIDAIVDAQDDELEEI